MIEVESLTKRYGSQTAVSDLTFDVPKGQVCGFLGPNGAGKSTTLRMLTGYLSPTEGKIRIGGVDAIADAIEARRQIGYMPEQCPLYPEMRVREYLAYRAALKGVARPQIKARVEAALTQATIADVADRIIGQLSKGYRQRVGLADALVADPPILVLDEPTAGLDPNQIRQVRALITELAKDKTVILSTHIMQEVEAICDRVLIINRGRLLSSGDPATLRRDTARQTIRLIGRGELEAFRAALEALEGITVVEVKPHAGGLVAARLEAEGEDAVEKVFRAIADADLLLRELRPQQTSLEEVFATLTKQDDASRKDEEE